MPSGATFVMAVFSFGLGVHGLGRREATRENAAVGWAPYTKCGGGLALTAAGCRMGAVAGVAVRARASRCAPVAVSAGRW
jgi:hypothetical protein